MTRTKWAGIASFAMIGLLASGGAVARDGLAQCRLEGAAGQWAGECRNGLAEGHGAARISTDEGIGVFAGRARAGRAVSGITTLPHGGFKMIGEPHAQTPDMDAAAGESEAAFNDSFAGAATASRTYAAAGNAASARYYMQLRAQLVAGQPE